MVIKDFILSTFKRNKQIKLDIEERKKEIARKTAQDFVNVRDIRDRFLYTRDGYIMTYIQATPIDINLLSLNEKTTATRALTAEISSERKPFKFLAVSRPVDISPLLTEYQNIINDTVDQIQKELLRQEMYALSNFALSGEVVERQFYFILWEVYEEGIERDILKRSMEFMTKLTTGNNLNIKCNVLDESKIVRLCNLINNPAYANIEETTFAPSIPLLTAT